MMRRAQRTTLAWFPVLLLLWGVAPAPRSAAAQTPPGRSKLWDGLRYPAAGRYHDLVSEAEVLLTGSTTDTAGRVRIQGLLREAIRRSPGRPQAWHVLGRLREQASQFGPAADAYARARVLDPLYQPRAVGYAFGMAALRAGRTLAAAQALHALLRPKDPPRLRATLLNNAAEAYLAAGHLRTARKLFREAVIADLTYPPPRWGLAVAAHRAEHWALASRLARAALQVDPDGRFLRSPRALYVPAADRHYHEALALEAQDQRERAQAAWQAFLRLAPRSPWRVQATRALGRLSTAPGAPGRRAMDGRGRRGAPRGRR